MSRKNKFLRQCCFCRSYKIKDELIKITKNHKTGELELNNNRNITGRSAYICKNENCISNALKKKKIETALKMKLTDSIKEKLSTVLKS